MERLTATIDDMLDDAHDIARGNHIQRADLFAKMLDVYDVVVNREGTVDVLFDLGANVPRHGRAFLANWKFALADGSEIEQTTSLS